MRCKYLLAAGLLFATAAPLGAQAVKDGIEAWQKSDYAAAVNIWRPLAEQGDADAQFNLGQAYRLGRGVQTNLAAAKSWFERAANQGHVDAETTLGLLLFQNNDQAEGLKWLKKAADKGEPRALLVYGTALVNGDSVTQDPALGYAYVSRAASKGLQPAKETLQQLDHVIPLAERKRGSALARELAKGMPASKLTSKGATKRVETASAKSAPSPAARSGEAAQAPAPQAKQPALRSVARTALAQNAEARRSPEISPSRKESGNRALSPAIGAWRIQLGAFSQPASAEALYKKISGNDALAGRQPFYIAAGAITRLQVGPFESKAAAAAACRKIAVACFVLPAK